MEASFLVSLIAGPVDPAGDPDHESLDRESIAKLVGAAGDIVTVIDQDGIVRNVTVHDAGVARETDAVAGWPGRGWADCVDIASRPKIESLLRDAHAGKPVRWVHVNHPAKRGPDIPVLYAAVRIGAGHVVAIGRDLRTISALQQRLVDAQQAMERDYVRLRHLDTRYRLLFQMSSEAVLIVDAMTHKTVEANPAARTLLGYEPKQSAAAGFPALFDAESRPAVEALLTLARTAGRADEVAAKSAVDGRGLLVSASLFIQDSASLFLARVVPAGGPTAPVLSNAKAASLRAIEEGPDGFVLTSSDGRVLAANAAFRDMAQLAAEEQARTHSLDHWLGRLGVDMNVMIGTLRQRGSLSLFATTVRGEYGASTDVEISAVTVTQNAESFYAFVIRNVGRRIATDLRIGRDMPRSVDQLTELIGRVPLKELVREATDMIERLCILAALEMTGDNRASAAEMLGLSRQSLYVKLHRHGLGDLAGEADNQA